MAYFTDTTNAPKVYLRRYNANENATVVGQDTSGAVTLTNRSRTVDINHYEFRGLTEAAADTIATGLRDTNTDAHAERMNDAGMWRVSVISKSYGAWA